MPAGGGGTEGTRRRSGTVLESSIPRPRVVPITDAIATGAGLLGRGSPGDPADRIIFATAIDLRVAVVTKAPRIAECGLVDAVR